jgi:glycosyltransferase involved in cell wall biosynthesis
MDGIFAFSGEPLRLTLFVGTVMCFVSALGIVYFIVWKLLAIKDIPGYASTNIIILMIGGLQLICLGIVGEYIKRIYDESKRRPKYIVAETYVRPDRP